MRTRSAPDRCTCGSTGQPLAGLPRQPRREAAMPEYRRIVLDGSVVQVRREGDDLLAGDGRRVAAADAVHLPPVVPTKIIAGHLNHHRRVPEFGATLPPAPPDLPKPVSPVVGHGRPLGPPAN